MLISLYCAALVLTALRALFYIATEAGAQLDIADNSNWMNTITPVFLAILPIIGTTAFILMCTDQVRRRWERVASKDYLTGLPNRRTLNDVGTERFERVRHLPVPHVVAVLDIDDFKRINDNHGHEVGDQVLKHVAACLQASMQADDFVARSGGEEFVIIFGERNSELPLIATEAIRRTIAESPFVVGENALPVTVSIGVAQKGDLIELRKSSAQGGSGALSSQVERQEPGGDCRAVVRS
ncbi:GGDEF domain-containing protein [Ochrobactrum pseudogrignonense]|nr:GGDEF domain-containing protein [Brucella pseudogrignonensis]